MLDSGKIIRYDCKGCRYSTLRRSDYEKHIRTRKHKKLNLGNDDEWVNQGYECECGRIYKHKQSLNNHKIDCKYDGVEIKEMKDGIDYKGMMTMLIKQNNDLMGRIGELVPKVGNNNNSNNNNLIKQKFNINLFLNEECKDALTMDEFIGKIKVTLDNLMITKEKGLAEGVSNIFIENMNKLSLYERPIHCTDIKRETVYIKGHGTEWEKDKESKKIKDALEKVGYVQRKELNKWIEAHPNWENNSGEQDEYMVLISKCMGDINENNGDNKIIKKICNEAYIGLENK